MPPIDHPRPNCAVVGVWNVEEASTIAYLSLYSLQHRGQEAAGIAALDEGVIKLHAEKGLVSDIFRDKHLLDKLKGKSAVGHNRYSTTGPSSEENVQPLLVKSSSGSIAMSHNGNLVNYLGLRNFLESKGSLFRTSSDSELILHLMANSSAKSVDKKLLEALNIVKGAYSLAILTKDCLIAARDPFGFRPLSLAKKDDGWIVASETCAFDLLDAEFVREVEPGEMIIIDNDGIRSQILKTVPEKAHCIFEFIYFSRPDSRIFGDNVDKTRRKLGKLLAQNHPVEDADIVISIPDSSNTAALGFSQASGVKFEFGLIRNHYIGRTFIEPEQKMRDFGVKIKFNVIEGVLKDKNVVVVDDSIVRGTTIKKLVRLIRKGGAKSVHVRISSPPIVNPCYYGMDFPTANELTANKKSIEEIREYIDADSLEYLSITELLSAAPNGVGQGYCTACFGGKYPVPISEQPDIVVI